MNYQKHDDRTHKSNLGTLVNNIQALETVIRGCLFKDELIKGTSTQLEKGISSQIMKFQAFHTPISKAGIIDIAFPPFLRSILKPKKGTTHR